MQTIEFILVITQLRDVRAAWQSAKMAMKHQQQPAPPVLAKVMNLAAAVLKSERDGLFPSQIEQSDSPPSSKVKRSRGIQDVGVCNGEQKYITNVLQRKGMF